MNVSSGDQGHLVCLHSVCTELPKVSEWRGLKREMFGTKTGCLVCSFIWRNCLVVPLQASSPWVLILFFLLPSMVQITRGIRERRPAGSSARSCLSWASPLILEQSSQWPFGSCRASFPLRKLGYLISPFGIFLCALWVCLHLDLRNSLNFSLCSFVLPFVILIAISLYCHYLEKVRVLSGRTPSLAGAELSCSCPGRCWSEKCCVRSAVCTVHPCLFLPPPDPGVQPGSRTLPFEAGQCTWWLHLRQPAGQPSQSHGQWQHGQEVCLSTKQHFVATAASVEALPLSLRCAHSSPLLLTLLSSHSPALPTWVQPWSRKYRLCELGEQSLVLGNSWIELCLCLVSETPWEGCLLSHLVDAVGGRSSETTQNICCPPAAKFVWHLKAHFLILKTIT